MDANRFSAGGGTSRSTRTSSEISQDYNTLLDPPRLLSAGMILIIYEADQVSSQRKGRRDWDKATTSRRYRVENLVQSLFCDKFRKLKSAIKQNENVAFERQKETIFVRYLL